MSATDESAGIVIQLDAATRRVVGTSVPPRLQAITDGHMVRLMALVEMMRAAGIDENLMRHSVRTLIQSYEEELIAVMTSLAQESQT